MPCTFSPADRFRGQQYQVRTSDIFQLKSNENHQGIIGPSSPQACACAHSQMVRKLPGMRNVQSIHAMRTH